jgi:uncharacterized coiled-coil protein SlyX
MTESRNNINMELERTKEELERTAGRLKDFHESRAALNSRHNLGPGLAPPSRAGGFRGSEAQETQITELKAKLAATETELRQTQAELGQVKVGHAKMEEALSSARLERIQHSMMGSSAWIPWSLGTSP